MFYSVCYKHASFANRDLLVILLSTLVNTYFRLFYFSLCYGRGFSFLHQQCNSVHVRFAFVLLLIVFQLLAYSFRRTRIYILNLSVRYGHPVIVTYVYRVRLKPVSVSYHVLYQFPYCRRLVVGGDLCVVPSVLNWVYKPVTENGTEIGTVLLVDTLRGSSGTQ
jgi:hypothetical protein